VDDDRVLDAAGRRLSRGHSRRAAVLELCRAHGVPCEERDLSLTDAYRADEMFCTGTMGELPRSREWMAE